MRLLFCGMLAGLVMTAPAFAQSSAAAPAAGTITPQAQPAKDSKSPADSAAQPKTPADPAPPPAKDDSMANYDVNGSNASDAMGRTP